MGLQYAAFGFNFKCAASAICDTVTQATNRFTYWF